MTDAERPGFTDADRTGWTDADNGELARHVNEGKPYRDIAAIMGRAERNVRRQAGRLGFSLRSLRERNLRKKLVPLFEVGATRETLMAAVNRSYYWVTRRRREIERETGRKIVCVNGIYRFAPFVPEPEGPAE